jgi:hypothetical protein
MSVNSKCPQQMQLLRYPDDCNPQPSPRVLAEEKLAKASTQVSSSPQVELDTPKEIPRQQPQARVQQSPKEDPPKERAAPTLTQSESRKDANKPQPKDIDVQKRIEEALRKRLQEQHQAELARKLEQSPKRQRVNQSPPPRRNPSRSRSRSPAREPVRREQRPVNLSLAVNAPSVERLVTDIPSPSHEPTDSLRISNFKRPCPLPEVKALLSQTGSVTKFWMNNIRSECLVSFSSVEEASATRRAVYGVKYPVHNDQTLVAEFCDPSEVALALGGQVVTAPALTPAYQPPSKALEDLFRKTAALPVIYWRPNDPVPKTPIEGVPAEDSN